jgi:acetyl esterase/lipase
MLSLVALAGLGACAPVDLLNATIPTRDLRIVRGVPYATGPLAANPSCTLDVYRPKSLSGPAPVVVFFYGGSWQEGRRQDYLFVAAELASRGLVVVVPDYRVYPQVRYPQFLGDGATAVAFSLASAESWGGEKRRVFVAGHSAGAYIAVMLALDPAYLAAAGTDRTRIAGTIGISGPYDFRPIVRPDIRAVFGAAADSDEAQPISHVDGHNQPMLLLTGDADTTVLPRNTLALAARIRAAGGPAQVRVFPGVGHIGTVTAFAPLLRDHTPVLDDVVAFIAATPSAV